MTLNCGILKLDDYFERVQYSGPRIPSYKTLINLCWCHVQNVPWDTLDLFCGLKKNLNLDKIYKNIVHEKKGGWCYEQNGLFGAVLEAIGFAVELLEGSCFMPAKDQFSFPFDHLFLKVEVDGKSYIVDVGYGVPSFFEPMLFTGNCEPQSQMNGIYRIREAKKNDYYVEKHRKTSVNAKTEEVISRPVIPSNYSVSDDWEIISRFSGTPRKWLDFEESCRNHQEDKDGFFTKNSFIEIYHSCGVDVLWGSKLIERTFLDPLTEKISVTDLLSGTHPADASSQQKEEVLNLIKTKFGVDLKFWPMFMSESYHE